MPYIFQELTMRMPWAIAGASGALAVLVSLAPPANAVPLDLLPPDMQLSTQQDALQKALADLHAGDLDKAQSEFERAAQDPTTAVGAHLGLAEIAHRKDDTARTEAELRAALAADPKSADAQTAWGLFLVAQKRDQEAASAFQNAINLMPQAIPPRMALAELQLTHLNQPGKAAELYRSVIAQQPKMASAHVGLGAALGQLNQPDAAIAEFTEAQQDAPLDPQPSYLLGQMQAGRGNTEQAITQFNRALRIQPNFMPAHVAKADILLAKGEYDAAIAEYQIALTQDPNLVPVLVNLGIAQIHDHQTNDAIASFQRALKLNPKQPDALNNLAWISAEHGDHLDEALSWAEQAVSLAPKDASFVDTLGWVYRARGQLPDAKVQFTRSLALQPDAETAYHLGLVESQLGDRAGAETAFRRALEIDANYAPASTALDALLHPK